MVLVVGTLVAAFRILEPTPPRRVVVSTGPPGSAYARMAERYRERLGEYGIELVLQASGGALENVERLLDPRGAVEVGFASFGLTVPGDGDDLRSLGSFFFEPVWVFNTTPDLGSTPLSRLAGLRLAIGVPGSLAHFVSLRLLELLEVPLADNEVLTLEPEAAAAGLAAGEVDVAFFVAAAGTPVVEGLLASEAVELVHFAQADAYVARYPALTRLTVPAGAGSFARRLPPRDVDILAFTGGLYVRESLHPAIQSLLVEAATEIHGTPDLFHTAGRFPRPESLGVPLSDPADQFYRTGRPFLQRYLPFWLAVLVKQALTVLLPLLGIVYPVVRLLPSLYHWIVERRLTRLYGELRLIEVAAAEAPDSERLGSLSEALRELDRRVRRMRFPARFSPLVYTLRLHIGTVLDRFSRSDE